MIMCYAQEITSNVYRLYNSPAWMMHARVSDVIAEMVKGLNDLTDELIKIENSQGTSNSTNSTDYEEVMKRASALEKGLVILASRIKNLENEMNELTTRMDVLENVQNQQNK